MPERAVPALLSIAIQPKTPKEIERLNIALPQLRSEMGGMRGTIDDKTGAVTVAAADEQQLEIVLDRHCSNIQPGWRCELK